MRRLAINIVWIKRDLRTLDHESFHAAESKNIPYLPVYIFDKDLIDYPDTSDRHLGFIYYSLIDINKKLSSNLINHTGEYTTAAEKIEKMKDNGARILRKPLELFNDEKPD